MAHMCCAVVGSRKYGPQKHVVNFVTKAVDAGWHIVSGGADGPDKWAEEAYYEQTGRRANSHKAYWYGVGGQDKYNPRAGLERNTLIVQDADMLAAFWDGVSSGTRDSIRKAIQKKIPVFVFDTTGTIIELYMEGERVV